MRIAVATPTGHIGSRLTGHLLDAGHEVTVLSRRADKVAGFAARGARVAEGDLLDAGFVARGLRGAEALFWLTPPGHRVEDVRGRQRTLGQNAARAVQETGVRRVVNLSSMGAQMPAGTGPIAGLHDVEKLLEETGAHVTHLRSAYFMENFFMSLEPIRAMGKVFLPVRGSVRIPMVATRDIADVAARVLGDSLWTGRRVVGIHGPADLRFDEAARKIGEAIGRDVEHVAVPADAARATLVEHGMLPGEVDATLEMFDAMDSGRLVVTEPRTPETTTPTTIETFARTALLPALRAAV